MAKALCRVAQEEARLFLTVCAYAYELEAISLIPDVWWDREMAIVAPELACTGMWVRQIACASLRGYSEQIVAIMKHHNRAYALHSMLFNPSIWKDSK